MILKILQELLNDVRCYLHDLAESVFTEYSLTNRSYSPFFCSPLKLSKQTFLIWSSVVSFILFHLRNNPWNWTIGSVYRSVQSDGFCRMQMKM